MVEVFGSREFERGVVLVTGERPCWSVGLSPKNHQITASSKTQRVEEFGAIWNSAPGVDVDRNHLFIRYFLPSTEFSTSKLIFIHICIVNSFSR